MNVGVNYMREHMPSDARIHYAMLDGGGVAPNVVQACAKVRYSIRARDLPGMKALIERVSKVADGAALMTETGGDAARSAASPTCSATRRSNRRCSASSSISGPRRSMRQTSSMRPPSRRRCRRRISPRPLRAPASPARSDTPLCDFVVPYGTKGAPMMGSTDVGDVSWVVPTVQARVATHAIGTPGHSWQITAQGKSGQAKKGMVNAAKVMAGVAVDALGDPAPDRARQGRT